MMYKTPFPMCFNLILVSGFGLGLNLVTIVSATRLRS